MTNFSIWCSRLIDYFFSAESAGKRVRLMMDEQTLERHFEDIGGSEAFIKAIQEGPDWIGSSDSDITEICKSLLHQWLHPDARPQDYPLLENDAPPFFSYLCLFSYAWTIEGDYHASDFNRRLAAIYPSHGLKRNQNMKWCTDHLWQGLSDWSNQHKTDAGIFKIERLGGMKHVGISRAQAIFRPEEIEILPQIFRACGLQPEDADDINNIHEALLLNHHSWHYRLSKSLPPLIMKWEQTNDPIAEAALLIMAEELSQWDGEADTNAKRYIPSIKIYRSLLVQGGTVQVQLCVADDNVLKLSNLKLVCEEDEIGTFRTEGPLLAILELKSSDWNPYSTGAPKTASAFSHDDDFGDEKHNCKWIPRSISLFNRELPPKGRLIETDTPPRSGECICLISPEGQTRFKNWCEEQSEQGFASKIDLPTESNWELYRLTNISSLEMDSFPLDRRASQERNLIRITSGTKTAPDTYMDYDLPSVSSTESGVEFTFEGAEATAVAAMPRGSGQLSNLTLTEFSLDKYDGNGSITITAKQGNFTQECFLRIIKSAELPDNLRRSDPMFSVNKFGWPERDGLRGTKITNEESQPRTIFEYNELPEDFFTTTRKPESIPEEKLHFIEALGLKRRFSYSDLKCRMMSLCTASEGDFFRAIRLMRDLGDVDLCIEDNGMISYIYPNSTELVLMPWQSGGKFVAALRGAYPLTTFRALLGAATKKGIDRFCLNHNDDLSGILPPTTYFKFDDIDTYSDFCISCGLKNASKTPAAYRLTQWSGNIDEWVDMLLDSPPRKHSGEIEKFYDANKFGFRTWSEEKQKTHRYDLFLISRRVGNFKAPPVVNFRKSDKLGDDWNIVLDVSVREPAWPKWYIQTLQKGPERGEMTYLNEEIDDKMPILYSREKMQLMVPRELSLPYVLSRALTLCSGVSPSRIAAKETNFGDIVGNFKGIENGNGYKGELWLYSGVSEVMAKLILAKVDAFPAEREHLGFIFEEDKPLSDYY